MYARCTHCNTIFKVTPEQLNIAKGYVRCGVCEQPFNALQNLQDQPDSSDKNAQSPKADSITNKQENNSSTIQKSSTDTKDLESTAKETLQFEQKDWFSGKLSYQGNQPKTGEDQGKQSEIIGDDDQDIFFKERSHVFTVVGGIDHIWQDASETPESLINHEKPDASSDISTIQDNYIDTDNELKDPAIDDNFVILDNKQLAKQLISDLEHHNKELIEIDIPPVTSVITEEELLVEQKQNKNPKISKKQVKNTALWSTGYVIALLLLCLQIIYAMRTDLAIHNEIRPILEVMCKITSCKLPPRRMPEKIYITNRNVRVHPKEKNALLVEATFINQALKTQAYPVVELSIYGYNGDLIGQRQFTPKEYTDDKPRDMLLRPDEEADLQLELVSPGKDVASFEFKFL